jgi:Helicase HerA, central domain
MSLWQGYRFHRLLAVLHDASSDREQPGKALSDTARSLLAALTAAHATLLASGDPDAAVLTAWIRSRRDGQLHLMLGGRPFFPPATGHVFPPAAGAAESHPHETRRAVLFPAGALAADVPGQEVADMLAHFPFWVACTGRADALWAPDQQAAPKVPQRGAFDRHVAHLGEPFAWLVIAQPALPSELKPELDTLVAEILPLSRGEVSEAKRVGLERKQARHRELSRSQVGGFWQVRILAGGTAADHAAAIAAALSAASDLDGLPYVISPGTGPGSLADAWHADIRDEHGSRAPFTASTELLVALTRPPAHELPGVRLAQPHTFDVTPENDGAGDRLHLGAVLDESMADVAELTLPTESLNRHAFVCGATGAGKSHTVRYLLEQASRAGIPWLVIEPAKAEYALTAARLAGFGQRVYVLRPGDPERPPAGLNPMQPAAGFPLQTHVDLLRALFLAAFEPSEPFPQILASALTDCYTECGWDLILGEPVQPGQARYPTLDDLQRVAEAAVDEIGYGPEVASNVRGFIKVRLASLRLGTTGSFFSSGHPIDFGALRARNVVLELEDVGDDTDKAFLIGAILMRLTEELRVASRAGTLPPGLGHLTVVEEAHRLLRRPPPGASGTAAHAVETFAAMLAEVRAYGEGLVIAEQIPGKLIPDVIKNTAVKVVHRLPAADDRESVGATINLDEAQSRFIVSLRRGEAAAFADGMDRPVLVRIPPIPPVPLPPAVPIGELVGRRSGTCGQDCVAEACTVRQIREAQRLLARESWLRLWCELSVLAHMTGQPAPLPRPEVLAVLGVGDVKGRTLDCAISHAVDDAVAVRSAQLQPETSAGDLAGHVCRVIRGLTDGQNPDCRDDPGRFYATPYRWDFVRVRLLRAPGQERHPATGKWERYYRRSIPGATRVEQLAAVQSWLVADLADPAVQDAVGFGARRPSVLEKAIGTAQAGRLTRVQAALEPFLNGGWAISHLVPPAAE